MNNSNLKSTKGQTAYQKAKAKAKELKSFYFSLIFYIIVNAGLVYIWFEYSSHNFQWFWFPIVGWGLGLVMKGLNVYEIDFLFGKQWEERKIKQFTSGEIPVENSRNEENNAYQNAKKKVDSIKGFYSHFTVYLVVNIFIVTSIVWHTAIDLFSFAALSTPFFWGIGLASHAIGVFGEDLVFGKDWEERKIKELMDTEYNNS